MEGENGRLVFLGVVSVLQDPKFRKCQVNIPRASELYT